MVTAYGEEIWRLLAAVAQPLIAEELSALSPMIILVPHPDDETLGCGGLIATLADLGLRPRIIYLTDGSASHRGSPTWSAERIASTRREEALQALSTLGVGDSDVTFLGWTDAKPHSPMSSDYEVTLARLSYLAICVAAKCIVAPWEKETHCDHTAANALALALAANISITRYEYMVWGWATADLVNNIAGHALRCLDCCSFIDLRRKALECHQTQLGALITDADIAFAMPSELKALVERPIEIFLEVSR